MKEISSSYNEQFKIIYSDLKEQKSKISSTAFEYAGDTINALHILEKNLPLLITISDENKRNNKISELTGLIAEPGLAPGSHPEEIKKNIILLIDKLFEAFDFDQAHEDTKSLYSNGFQGPPCFNGRIITLNEYIYSKQQLKDPKLLADNKPYDKDACVYQEFLYKYQDEKGSENLPNFEEFIEYLKTFPDFETKHSQIVESKNFIDIYNRACELCLSLF